MVLSPIAHENLGPPLPDGMAHNDDLALYWRPANMEYIRGRRREPFGLETYPREFDRLRQMVEERDVIVWERAKAASGFIWSVPPGESELWEQLPVYDATAGGDR